MTEIHNFLLRGDRWLHSRFGYSVKPIPNIYNARLTDYNHNLGFHLESEANECIKVVRSSTMLPYIRLVTLYQQVVHCEKNGIDGCFVECGVWKGGSVALMAMANLRHGGQRRHIHLFDAFDDIPEPDRVEDGENVIKHVANLVGRPVAGNGQLAPLKGAYDRFGGFGSIEENKHLLEDVVGYDPAHLHYHKGYFQQSLPLKSREIGAIAILRLDGDWYASTKVCLEHLFEKVVKGGFMIIDDYGEYDGCRKAVDEFMARNAPTAYLHQVDSSCVYVLRT